MVGFIFLPLKCSINFSLNLLGAGLLYLLDTMTNISVKLTCDLCIKWIHIRCNNLNDLNYEYLKTNDETCYCKTCIQEILPFYNKQINPNKINLIKLKSNLKNLLCQLNNLSEKKNIDNENLSNCKYRDISYFSNLDVELKLKCLLFFHLNMNSF